MSEPDAIPHVIEPAASGRSRCRGCGRAIARGELRFGERLPNPYADGEMTLWLHLQCAAYRRPQPFLATLQLAAGVVDDVEGLAAAARFAVEYRRVPRIAGLERAPSGRARCRACRKPIARDGWRIPLVFYQEGMFDQSGYVHIDCADDYFGTRDLLAVVGHFAALDEVELADAGRYLSDSTGRLQTGPGRASQRR